MNWRFCTWLILPLRPAICIVIQAPDKQVCGGTDSFWKGAAGDQGAEDALFWGNSKWDSPWRYGQQCCKLYPAFDSKKVISTRKPYTAARFAGFYFCQKYLAEFSYFCIRQNIFYSVKRQPFLSKINAERLAYSICDLITAIKQVDIFMLQATANVIERHDDLVRRVTIAGFLLN